MDFIATMKAEVVASLRGHTTAPIKPRVTLSTPTSSPAVTDHCHMFGRTGEVLAASVEDMAIGGVSVPSGSPDTMSTQQPPKIPVNNSFLSTLALDASNSLSTSVKHSVTGSSTLEGELNDLLADKLH